MGMLDYVRMKTRQRLLAGEAVHWVKRSKRARYIAAVILSAPPWVDRSALRRIQDNCRAISALSGVEHHVCHIVPLNHPLVCGLTVPWNLEIKPAKINLAESNHWNNDRQLSLFPDNHEQPSPIQDRTSRTVPRRPRARNRSAQQDGPERMGS